MKRLRWGVLMAVLLLLATGCAQQTITVTPTPASGYPAYAASGLPVAFTVQGGGDQLQADFGDGTTEIENAHTFTHTYSQSGTFTCTVTSGSAAGSCVVTVLDDPPDVLPPFYNEDKVDLGAFVYFNPHAGYAGCDNHTGEPLLAYGVWDRNGLMEGVELMWFAFNRETGKAEGIFSRDGDYINGTWVPVQMVAWFAGRTSTVEPYPAQIPYYPLSLDVAGCLPDPPPPPECCPGPCVPVDFQLIARDRWGATGSAHWTILVCGKGCDSSE